MLKWWLEKEWRCRLLGALIIVVSAAIVAWIVVGFCRVMGLCQQPEPYYSDDRVTIGVEYDPKQDVPVEEKEKPKWWELGW